MKISRLKSMAVMTCCLVFALFAKSQGMDDASDLREVTLKADHSASYLDSLKPEISNDSQDKALLLIEDEKEEKSEASWTLYVASPIKAVIDGTYDIVDFAVKHPTQATIASLLIAAQFTAVAAWSVQIPIPGPRIPVVHDMLDQVNEEVGKFLRFGR